MRQHRLDGGMGKLVVTLKADAGPMLPALHRTLLKEDAPSLAKQPARKQSLAVCIPVQYPRLRLEFTNKNGHLFLVHCWIIIQLFNGRCFSLISG
jgi:hypothetical protein